MTTDAGIKRIINVPVRLPDRVPAQPEPIKVREGGK